MHTSAKHAEKALLAKVPAKEISEFEFPPATIASKERQKENDKVNGTNQRRRRRKKQ